MSRLVVRPEAEADLTEATSWYEEREPGLGLELLIDVGSAMRRAMENPLLYRLFRLEPEVRRVLARRFPYRIFFIVRPDALIVFAILHAARHDEHWQKRI